MNAEPWSRWTAPKLRALKGRRRIAMLTASDYAFARILDEAGLPAILVGDSLAMTVLGYESTLPVTLEEMLHHVRAVGRAVRSALLIADLPFMTYQVSPAQALAAAGKCLQAGAGAVKLEGGAIRGETIRTLVDNGVPVLGHVGLLPQSVRTMGGYKVQGRTTADADRLLEDAQAVEAAGAFGVVLEGIPAAVAGRITAALKIPTIGIGAGSACDGQVLVLHDLAGLTFGPPPRFVKRYADLGGALRTAVAAYRDEVEQGRFPGEEHAY